jgi:hypothetical protein
MQKGPCFFAAIVVIVFAASPTQATPVATVSTSAAYDTYTDSESDISFDIAVPAEAHAHAWVPGYPADYGKSDAWAAIGGSVRAYSGGQGARGGSITTSADSTQTAEWLITSDTLAPGTSVSILLDVSFKGSLFADFAASLASASLNLGDTTLYEGTGTAPRRGAIESTGAWEGDFVKSGWWFLLDTTDRIGFDAEVGQTIALTLTLHTEAYVASAAESGSVANFSDSGIYTFVGAEDPLDPGTMLDVDFVMVPEPTTLLLFSLGCLGLIRKHRA